MTMHVSLAGLGWLSDRLRALPEDRVDALAAAQACLMGKFLAFDLAVGIKKGRTFREALTDAASGQATNNNHHGEIFDMLANHIDASRHPTSERSPPAPADPAAKPLHMPAERLMRLADGLRFLTDWFRSLPENVSDGLSAAGACMLARLVAHELALGLERGLDLPGAVSEAARGVLRLPPDQVDVFRRLADVIDEENK